MLSDDMFEELMEKWSEWCLSGCSSGLGYPKASAFVNDYRDHTPGSMVLIDDDSKLEAVEKAVSQVARTKGIGRSVARVLRIHYQAHQDYLHLRHHRRVKKSGVKTTYKYYKYLKMGQDAVKELLERSENERKNTSTHTSMGASAGLRGVV